MIKWLIVLLCATVALCVYPSTHPQDIAALEDFYNAMGGETWDWLTGAFMGKWEINVTDPCADPDFGPWFWGGNWWGIICDESDPRRVIGFDALSSWKAVGSLPASFTNLTELQILLLHGSPGWVDTWTPSMWDVFPHLREVDFTDCSNLTWNLPGSDGEPWIWSELESIIGENSGVDGNFPPNFGDAPSMVTLKMSGCSNLGGVLPERFPDSLEIFDMSNTQVGGVLPVLWHAGMKLTDLAISKTLVSGELPKELGVVNSMKHFDFSHTMIGGPLQVELAGMFNLITFVGVRSQVSGPLPRAWRVMQYLVYISLGDTFIEGSIPPEWGDMHSLTSVSLYNTNISGAIPVEFGNAPLNNLDISNTKISNIPEGFRIDSAGLLRFCPAPDLSGTLRFLDGHNGQLQLCDAPGVGGDFPSLEWGGIIEMYNLPGLTGQMSLQPSLNAATLILRNMPQVIGMLPYDFGDSGMYRGGMVNVHIDGIRLIGFLPNPLPSVQFSMGDIPAVLGHESGLFWCDAESGDLWSSGHDLTPTNFAFDLPLCYRTAFQDHFATLLNASGEDMPMPGSLETPSEDAVDQVRMRILPPSGQPMLEAHLDDGRLVCLFSLDTLPTVLRQEGNDTIVVSVNVSLTATPWTNATLQYVDGSYVDVFCPPSPLICGDDDVGPIHLSIHLAWNEQGTQRPLTSVPAHVIAGTGWPGLESWTADDCGIAGGNNTNNSCCALPEQFDACGVCNGSAIAGDEGLCCETPVFGVYPQMLGVGCCAPMVADACGTCTLSASVRTDPCLCGPDVCDCKGNAFGDAMNDTRGVCCEPTDMSPCGFCLPDPSCTDCFGTLGGTSVRDICGVCNGTGSFDVLGHCCQADEQVPTVTPLTNISWTQTCCTTVDKCGECEGTTSDPCLCVPIHPDCNQTADCSGNITGNLKYDACHVCDGLVNDACLCDPPVAPCDMDRFGCDGVLDSHAVVDECGVCAGKGIVDDIGACCDVDVAQLSDGLKGWCCPPLSVDPCGQCGGECKVDQEASIQEVADIIPNEKRTSDATTPVSIMLAVIGVAIATFIWELYSRKQMVKEVSSRIRGVADVSGGNLDTLGEGST